MKTVFRNSLIAALLFIGTNALQAQVNYNTEVAGVQVSMDIPDFMTETWQLNDNAILQYNNTMKELYIVVIEDSKGQLIELGAKFAGLNDFNKFSLEDFTQDATQVGTPYSFTLNGKKAIQTEVRKDVEDLNLYFLFTTVETDGHFYKVLTWTLKEFEKEHAETMKAMVNSFKEL